MPSQSQVPVVEHGVILPKKHIAAAHGVLEQKLVVPNFFQKKSMLDFAGAEGSKLFYKVPGALPWREYAMRNDRTDALVFDTFEEAEVEITVTGRLYSGVRITDEQNDFDEVNPGYVVPMQAAAVARGVEKMCASAFTSTEFPFVIGGLENDPFKAFVTARQLLNKLNNEGTRTALVGSDVAAVLLYDERVSRALNSGDTIAERALQEATIGRLAGFNIVESGSVAPDEVVFITGDAFTLFTGAPQPPAEVVSASRNYNGVAMTWLQDYETERLMRRSVLVTYAGTAPAKDFLQKYNETTRMPERSAEPHFVRGVKAKLAGTSSIVNQDVADFAGVTSVPTITAPAA